MMMMIVYNDDDDAPTMIQLTCTDGDAMVVKVDGSLAGDDDDNDDAMVVMVDDRLSC